MTTPIRRIIRTDIPVGQPSQPGVPAGPPPGGGGHVRDALRAWLGGLKLVEAARQDDALLVGLEIRDGAGRRYVLLHEAIAAGSAQVSEQGGGNVNVLTVTNKGGEPVLVLEGELVVGAKQNRTITETLLVAPGTAIPVQVGCVERGRWDQARTPFSSGRQTMEPSTRRATVKEMALHGAVDQARLWADVHGRSQDFAAQSPTGDYHSVVEKQLESSSRLFGQVPDSPARVGMMVLLDGRFVGMDVVSHPLTWSALAGRLLPSYFVGLDVMRRHPEMLGDTARARPEEWLGHVTLGQVRTAPTAGLGERVLVATGGINGAGLWHVDHPAHLALFAD